MNKTLVTPIFLTFICASLAGMAIEHSSLPYNGAGTGEGDVRSKDDAKDLHNKRAMLPMPAKPRPIYLRPREQCGMCPATLLNIHVLATHLMSVHKNIIHSSDVVIKELSDSLFQCGQCPETFTRKKQLYVHFNEKHASTLAENFAEQTENTHDGVPVTPDHAQNGMVAPSAASSEGNVHSEEDTEELHKTDAAVSSLKRLAEQCLFDTDDESSYKNSSEPRKKMATKGDTKNRLCFLCNHEFPDATRLGVHLMFSAKHKDIIPSVNFIIKDLPHRKFQCGQCTDIFTRKSKVYSHFNEKHLPKLLLSTAGTEKTESTDNEVPVTPSVLPGWLASIYATALAESLKSSSDNANNPVTRKSIQQAMIAIMKQNDTLS